MLKILFIKILLKNIIMSENKKNITQKDSELWETVTKTDKKYSKSNRMVFNKKTNLNKNIKTEDFREDKLLKQKNLKESNKIIIAEKDKLKFQENLDPMNIPSGISSSQAQNLRKGKIRPEVKIDLHGFTQEKAYSYLKDKLTELYKKNIRCILIITGKKIGKHGSEGVLKREVPKWLNISPLREKILMTSWAQPIDGGDGALYVLLKKKRKV